MAAENEQKTTPGDTQDKKELEQRKRDTGNTLCCPYCGDKLKKWEVPQTVFTQWPNEFLYVCFNDACSYYIGGWEAMAVVGNTCSYRLMYDPITNTCNPIPVFGKDALKDGIKEEKED